MPLTDQQMDQFEAHFDKKTKRRCPMCGGRKFEFSMNPLGMFRVDARAAVKIPDLERGRAMLFVNCKECGYYMFFKPEVVGIGKRNGGMGRIEFVNSKIYLLLNPKYA